MGVQVWEDFRDGASEYIGSLYVNKLYTLLHLYTRDNLPQGISFDSFAVILFPFTLLCTLKVSLPSFYVFEIMTTIHLSPYNGLHGAGNGVGPAPAVESMNGLSSACINPAQVSQNAHAGPSSANSAVKKKTISSNKRKRTDTSDDGASQQRKNRDGPRKKKANRACFHCQKAHLTCDDCE